MQWIKRNTEKDAQKGENAALDRWTTEGGSVADETNARVKKRALVYREHKQRPLQRPNNQP